ncbi:Hypothetical protein FKW44_002313, partial [Caligus rogercresseyi]
QEGAEEAVGWLQEEQEEVVQEEVEGKKQFSPVKEIKDLEVEDVEEAKENPHGAKYLRIRLPISEKDHPHQIRCQKLLN